MKMFFTFSSILSEIRSREKRVGISSGEKVTNDFSASRQATGSKKREEQPEWLVGELLKQKKKRHSIALGDQAQLIRQQHTAGSTCSLQVQFKMSTGNIYWRLLTCTFVHLKII